MDETLEGLSFLSYKWFIRLIGDVKEIQTTGQIMLTLVIIFKCNVHNHGTCAKFGSRRMIGDIRVR